jgi:predicted MFS family arabinose efflux permease
MLALPAGAALSLWLGPRAIFFILMGTCTLGFFVARRLPDQPHAMASSGKRFKAPDSVAVWSFIEGVALDGLFIFGLSLQAQKVLGGDAMMIAGLLMGLRYLSELVLSPLGGWAAQRFGATAMLLVFSISSALALTVFGNHWVIVGGAAVLVLRALQLPLVSTLVAERNPGPARVQALASNAVWRDVGAGLGPLLAGIVLPVASAPWVFGLAGLAIALSALACQMRRG